jgi:FkbM family methyltransferase
MYDANQHLNFVCIEPDGRFFGYLQTNADRLLSTHGRARIQLVKSLVGKGVTSASLVDSTGGTKKAVVTDDQTALHSETLDAIGIRAEVPNLRLIKSDVDGFDYDVVDSAESLIKESAPILFFECQLDHLFQKQAYERTLTMLDTAGYRDWVVFDNFGEVVLRTPDLRVVLQLFGYLWRQNTQRTSRTIYYYDLLACHPRDLATVDQAVSHHLGEC